MRIVCQKCAAAYAIDDRVITPKGVRAQCPRCRHLQLVKREESPAQPAAAPVPTPAPKPAPSRTPSLSSDDLFGDMGDLAPPDPEPESMQVSSLLSELAAPAPSSSDFPEPSGDPLFDDIAPPPPAPAPAAPAPMPGFQFQDPSEVSFDDIAAPVFSFPDPGEVSFDDFAAPSAAAQPAPESDPLLDFFSAPPSAPQPAQAPAPAPEWDLAPASAPVPSAPMASPAAPPRSCAECGKPLLDEFDQALGSCESCRQQARKPEPAPKAVEVLDLPPMSGPSMGTSPAPTPLPTEPRGAGRAVAASVPTLSPEALSGVRPAAQRPAVTGVSGVAVSAGGGGRGGLVVVLLLVLLLGGAGAAYVFVPEVKALVSEQLGNGESPAASGSSPKSSGQPPAVEAVLPAWQMMFPDLDGDSNQLVTAGQALLVKDQRLAYAQAEESFQRALLLDPGNDAAIGGYVQALALGRGKQLDEKSFQQARALIEAAEERAGRKPELLVAHANLLLTRASQPEFAEQTRQLAEQAAGMEDVWAKTEAHLVLGRLFLASSRELANHHFETAQTLAPDLKRVHYYRALAHEAAGDYSLALQELEKRLSLDPEHWDSLAAMARIFLEVDETARARKLYEARLKSAPRDFQALLSLAVLRYQVEGSVSGALGSLRALLRNREKYDEREVAELLLHLATVERLAGNLDAAAKWGRESLSLVKANPAVHLQLFLVALARGDSSAAAGHLSSVRGQLDDPALEKLLEGRLRLAERKPAEAMEAFQEAARLDGRRGDAVLLAGVAAAKAGRRDEAFRVLAQMRQVDPLRLAPRPVVSSFYLRPAELLLGMEGSIAGLSSGRDDLLPHLYEGLLRFHQGESAAAERLLRKVVEVDSTNSLASAYRALISLGRRDKRSARGHAARAVAGGRQEAIAHLSLGLVLAELKEEEPAKRSLREALALAPSLSAAEVRLAELEASSNRDSARSRLLRLVGLDPSYLEARRVLYMLDRRG